MPEELAGRKGCGQKELMGKGREPRGVETRVAVFFRMEAQRCDVSLPHTDDHFVSRSKTS